MALGRFFDRQIVEQAAALVGQQYNVDPYADAAFMCRLSAEAESAKIQLAASPAPEIVIFGYMLAGLRRPVDMEHALDREEFERLIEEAVQAAATWPAAWWSPPGAAGRCEPRLLVGGSTLIPAVRRAVGAVFGRRKSWLVRTRWSASRWRRAYVGSAGCRGSPGG